MNNNTKPTENKVFKYVNVCSICGKTFQTNYERKKACSKECKRALDNQRSKQWREANKEQFHESMKIWRENNKEYKALKDKEYRERNREHVLNNKRKHYQKNRKHYQQYRVINKERRSKYMKEYRSNNKILFQEKEARRIATKKKAFVENVHRKRIIKKQNYKCNACGIELLTNESKYHKQYPNLDHIVPLSKGGFHGMENAQYLCRSCNMAKSDNISEEWNNLELYERFKREGKLIIEASFN